MAHLLVLLAVLLSTSAPVIRGGLAFAPCVPHPTFRPCNNCSKADLLEALLLCDIKANSPVRTVPKLPKKDIDPTKLAALYDQTKQGGRLGNQFGAYFTAIGFALVSGLPLRAANFSYGDIYLHLDPIPAADSAEMYRRAPRLRHFCLRCPVSHQYPHACPGLWTVTDIVAPIRKAITGSSTWNDVVIQFRCGDSHSGHVMGLLPLEYYLLALDGNVYPSSHILILPDPLAMRVPCCLAMMHVLLESLLQTFQCQVTIAPPSKSVAHDFAMMIQARVLVAGPSTFGLFAAIAAHCKAFLPATELFAGGEPPCFPSVRWIQSCGFSGGCSTSVFRWFFNNTRTDALQGRLERMLNGTWFARRRTPHASTA